MGAKLDPFDYEGHLGFFQPSPKLASEGTEHPSVVVLRKCAIFEVLIHRVARKYTCPFRDGGEAD